MIQKYLDYNGLSHLSSYIKERLVIVKSIPNSPSNGDIILYMGNTNQNFKHGGIYTYDATNNKWDSDFSKIRLNGIDTTGDVDFYAPTQSGKLGQLLISQGANQAPIWHDLSYYPIIDGDTVSFSFGTVPKVEGNSLIFEF